MFWNAQSITSNSKQLLLDHTLETEKVDVLLLAETFLKQHHSFSIRNFIVFRNDRQLQAHGGVAIAIRNNIQHKVCSPVNTHIIENISIEITINNTPVRITSAYAPRASQHFANDIELLKPDNIQYMIFGDLNAKHVSWNCRSNNSAGISLFSLQQNNDFSIYHTDKPHSLSTLRPNTINNRSTHHKRSLRF